MRQAPYCYYSWAAILDTNPMSHDTQSPFHALHKLSHVALMYDWRLLIGVMFVATALVSDTVVATIVVYCCNKMVSHTEACH